MRDACSVFRIACWDPLAPGPSRTEPTKGEESNMNHIVRVTNDE